MAPILPPGHPRGALSPALGVAAGGSAGGFLPGPLQPAGAGGPGTAIRFPGTSLSAVPAGAGGAGGAGAGAVVATSSSRGDQGLIDPEAALSRRAAARAQEEAGAGGASAGLGNNGDVAAAAGAGAGAGAGSVGGGAAARPQKMSVVAAALTRRARDRVIINDAVPAEVSAHLPDDWDHPTLIPGEKRIQVRSSIALCGCYSVERLLEPGPFLFFVGIHDALPSFHLFYAGIPFYSFPPSRLQKLDNIHYIAQNGRETLGQLLVTLYQMYFFPYSGDKQPDPRGCMRSIVAVPLSSIEIMAVDKRSIKPIPRRGESAIVLDVACKDVRVLHLGFESQEEFSRSFEGLKRYVFPEAPDQVFAFYYKSFAKGLLPPSLDGWTLYNPIAEYARQGLPNAHFSVTQFNADFGLCASYPGVLALPAALTQAEYEAVVAFRSGGRAPAMTWRNPYGGAQTMWRCAQPRSGMMNSRCTEDESMFDQVRTRFTQ